MTRACSRESVCVYGPQVKPKISSMLASHRDARHCWRGPLELLVADHGLALEWMRLRLLVLLVVTAMAKWTIKTSRTIRNSSQVSKPLERKLTKRSGTWLKCRPFLNIACPQLALHHHTKHCSYSHLTALGFITCKTWLDCKRVSCADATDDTW